MNDYDRDNSPAPQPSNRQMSKAEQYIRLATLFIPAGIAILILLVLHYVG